MRERDPGQLLLDSGVLRPVGVCEYQGFDAVRRLGGRAVLPWRSQWQAARRASVEAVALNGELLDARFDQAVVRLQKSRAATWRDLADAWARLREGGRLVLCGGNELGIASAVKRLAAELGQTPVVAANRARARAVFFAKRAGAEPLPPDSVSLRLPTPGSDLDLVLELAPGLFSAKRLDAGTRLMLDCLPGLAPPECVLDLGCGAGPLGIAALARWPGARAHLADADARAVACAERNAERAGLGERCTTHWWEAGEELPATKCDLVLVNPPFHSAKQVDLAGAHAMLACLPDALSRRGVALIVANRTLPYERPLRAIGELETLRSEGGFKLLAVRLRGRRRSHSS